MKKLIRTASIIMICGALCIPSVSARGRNNNSNSHNTEQHKTQNNSNKNNRPGNHPNNHSNNGHNNNSRPGNNGHNNNNFKPGNNSHNNQFGNNGRPQQPQFNNQHNNHPNFGGHNNYRPTPPPPRPHMPVHNPWHRPTPPPNFRPAPGWRPINTILGISLGSAVNFTVNALINAGYAVNGYANDAIYVTNVPMLNMMWPDATLFYGNRGLYASEFVYSTAGYDTNRYYRTYNTLVNNYGNPSQYTNTNGILTATWWGNNGQFIKLSFTNGLAINGTNRFFTTLSFGN